MSGRRKKNEHHTRKTSRFYALHYTFRLLQQLLNATASVLERFN